MNVFADFQARVGALIEKRIEAGELPARPRSRPLRGRAAARRRPRRSLDQRGDGLREGGEGRRLEPARARRTARRRSRRRTGCGEGGGRRTRIYQYRPESRGLREGPERRSHAGRSLRRRPSGRRPAGERRICQRQSDRADACRARARRGVRRRAGQPPELRRLSGDARILHQRRRRPGERARPLGPSALPRGARRGDRRSRRGSIRATTSRRSAKR